jgi:hypothetical protein
MLPLNPCSFSFIAIKYRYTQNVNGACKVWFWNSLLLVSRPCCWSNRTSEGRSGWTLFFKLELCFESSDMLMHLYNPFMLRVVQSHIYGVCTVFLAGFVLRAATCWCTCTTLSCLGLFRAIYIRCMYDISGREITNYTVIYGAYIWLWPTLPCTHVPTWWSFWHLQGLVQACL